VKFSYTANVPSHQCCFLQESNKMEKTILCLIALLETTVLCEPDSAGMPLNSNEGESCIKGPGYYSNSTSKIIIVGSYFMRRGDQASP
jgi:hypothetical protein